MPCHCHLETLGNTVSTGISNYSSVNSNPESKVLHTVTPLLQSQRSWAGQGGLSPGFLE